MSDITIGAIFGIFLGFMISGLIILVDPTSYRNVHKQAIEECEKELPRSQTCVVIAVPKLSEKSK